MGLDAAILGMVNQVLRKPTGGVDWSSLTPYVVSGKTEQHFGTETTIAEIIGAGYLTGLDILMALREEGLTVKLYLDDILIDSWDVEQHEYTARILDRISQSTSGYIGNHHIYRKQFQLTPLWHFNNSLRLTAVHSGSQGSGDLEWHIYTAME